MGDEKSKFNIYQYEVPGPIAARYIQSEGPIDCIVGPWGSGKTVATVFKIARHAGNLFPVCKDGVVHVRCAAIRDTYREMAKTALSSWHEFFPKRGPFTAPDRDAYSGGQDRPVKHILDWKVIRKWPGARGEWVPRETTVRLEMEFGAIGEQNLDSFFKGYEISMGWMNECDLLHKDVPGRFYGRTARYPPRVEVAEWEAHRLGLEKDPDTGVEVIRLPRIIMGDYNPPDETNWTYERHIDEPEKWPGYNFFQQPSGLSPQAENRRGKSRSQYEEEERAFGVGTADAMRNVHGQYAAKSKGTVIFKGFNLLKHRASEPLRIVPELPFYIGMDAGGRPAAVFGQIMPNGQRRVQREVVSLPDTVTGPARFAEKLNEVILRDYRNMRCAGAWADPASWYGADKIRGELAWVETVQLALQIPIQPTASNDLGSRFDAVDWYFGGDIDAHTPRVLIDPSCKYLIRAYVSQYHLTKHSSEGKTDADEVEKNEYSHVAEADQYWCYGYRGPQQVKKDAARMGRPDNVVPLRSTTARADFNVFKT